jgi:pyruvate/2-oxoacid:ferredoxin oxidoreductase alpha subunit
MEYIAEILKILVPVFTLILGSVLTYHYAVKSKRGESALKYKEEQYAKLLVKLQGFVGPQTNNKTHIEFFEEQYKSWLYSSDEVIEKINDMISLIRNGDTPDEETGREALGNIVLAMRKDLGQKTRLTYDAFEYMSVKSK